MEPRFKKNRLSVLDKIGRLTLLHKISKPISKAGGTEPHWYCICECGNTKYVRSCALTSRNTSSCGCLFTEHLKRASALGAIKTKKYNAATKATPLFKKWRSMWSRTQCNRGEVKSIYKDRGIQVCPEWVDFYKFKEFAEKNNYRPGLSIDRIDNDAGYLPTNVRFVTMEENLKNRRPRALWTKSKIQKS